MHRLLDRIERRGDLFTKDAFVFASRKGTGLERKTARAALKRAVIAAQLDSPHPTLHDRRHTHASMLIGLDFNVVEVQHRLGHKSPNITLDFYAHESKLRDTQKSEIGNKLGRLLAGRADDMSVGEKTPS